VNPNKSWLECSNHSIALIDVNYTSLEGVSKMAGEVFMDTTKELHTPPREYPHTTYVKMP